MSESENQKVLFTIAADGRIGMFPSAAALESSMEPADADATRVFEEDGTELLLQVELELYNRQIDAVIASSPIEVPRVLVPDEPVKDESFLKLCLLKSVADLPVDAMATLPDVVDAVKHRLSYGFH